MTQEHRYADQTSAHTSGEQDARYRLTSKEFGLSFQFSQGNNSLQRFLFHFLHASYPEFRLSGEEAVALFAQCTGENGSLFAVVKRPERHTVLSADDPVERVDSEARVVLTDLVDVLAGPVVPLTQIVPVVAKRILEKDKEYLQRPGGRRRHSVLQSTDAPARLSAYNPHTDPWLSHTCYYALEGHPTGSPLYDALFAQVGAYWRDLPENHSLHEQLLAVQSLSQQRHAAMP